MSKQKKKASSAKSRVVSRTRSTSALSSALAAKSTQTSSKNSMVSLTQLCMMYVALLITHVIVVYIAHMIFPAQIVLGTHMLSPMMALLYSMAVFTLIGVAATPVIQQADAALSLKMSDKHWMVIYFLINAVSLWGVARMAEMLGLGVASWVVVVALAVVLTPIQGMVVKKIM